MSRKSKGAPPRNFWSPEDDLRLRAAKAMDLPWCDIAPMFPSRTPDSCSARYSLLKARNFLPLVPASNKPKLDKHVALVRSQVEIACTKLAEATCGYYQREAERRGTTAEAIRILSNRSPAEIARFVQARAA